MAASGRCGGMQLGLISREQMKCALLLAVILSLLSGALLIFVACNTAADVFSFLCLGVLSIIAAITYTVGTRPYGYMGLGDLSVLIFFGWLSVGGSYYLQTGAFHAVVILPATACRLLAAAVLCLAIFALLELHNLTGWLFLLAVPALYMQARYVLHETRPLRHQTDAGENRQMRADCQYSVRAGPAAGLTRLLF